MYTKTSIKALVFLALISMTIYAKDRPLDIEKLRELKKTVKVLGSPTITIVDGIEKDSIYFLQLEVKKKRGIKVMNAFIEKESMVAYIGTRYDENGIKTIFPKTKKSIKLIEEGISFTYGSGDKELYVVTDPECPYCVKFEKAIKNNLEDYMVHVILYPLHFHKKAPAMVSWIMQGKDANEKKQRMEELMLEKSKKYEIFINQDGKSLKYTKSMKIKIDKAVKAAKILGATGTPAVFDEKFNRINWTELFTKNEKKKSVDLFKTK